MATAVSQQSSDNAYKPHRTQAMPKNSLFGTSLEINDKKEQQPVAEQCVGEKQVPGKQELAHHLKALLPSNERVIRKRQEFERQKDIVRQRQKELKSVENKALTFDPDPKNTTEESRTAGSRNSKIDKTHQWFTKNDIEHVREINAGGLTDSGSYNRDKYGRRPPIHSYSQMGDLLRPGMEFTPREEKNNFNQNSNSDRKPRLTTNITNDMEMPSTVPKQPSPHSVIALPPNIRHKFGSKICDELLSDEKKVTDTIAKQERHRYPASRDRRSKTPEFEKSMNPGYNGLSNVTRQNVFPGYTAGHKQSITKTVYNDLVHEQRYPDPDEYRYQRDELSMWAQHNILRQRMSKKWEEYLDTLPKPSANWDRGAKRSAPLKTAEPRQKPKSKPKPKAKSETIEKPSSPFETVEFKTPPITPPPGPAPLPKPETVEKDDDFWKFYDQSVPT